MGILSNIFHKIFPGSHPAVAKADQAQVNRGSMQGNAPQTAPQQSAPQAAPQAAPRPAAPPAQAPMEEVDVEAILSAKAAHQGQQLNWRTSIVDLLKLLDIDSSLQARKELAQELDYKGDTGDSASMNIWLHRQVMNRLAANGGKVPADLRD
jgi:hypothetical protein